MTLKIVAGAFYKARGGTVEGPMRESAGSFHSPARGPWQQGGRYGFATVPGHGLDLIERIHVLNDADLEAVKHSAINDMFKAGQPFERFGLKSLTVGPDDLAVEFATEAGGSIVLARWPQGFVLRYHGEIIWRSWEHDKKITVTVAAAGLKEIGEAIKKTTDDAVRVIRDKIEEAQDKVLNKALINAVFGATMRATEKGLPEGMTAEGMDKLWNDFCAMAPKPTEEQLRRRQSLILATALGMHPSTAAAYTKARSAHVAYLNRARVIGVDTVRALAILGEELKKAEADPKATMDDVVRAAERRLVEGASR